MLIIKIVLFASMFFWLFPPIKNRGTIYFNFFLLLAISDPVKILFGLLFRYQNSSVSLMLAFLTIAVLIENKKMQITTLVLSLILPAGMLVSKIPPTGYLYVSVPISFIIIVIISIRITRYLAQNKTVNLFMCLLLVYVSITAFKKLALLFNPETGEVSFLIGGAFQILFAVAFTIVNANTKNFKLIKE